MEITAKDLRFNTAEIFDVLSKGEDIIITYRGKAKAKLIGLNKQKKKEDIAFGMWRDQSEEVNEIVRKMRKGRRFDI
ncbi:type II toxin-antitoxin system Phd/YefM family antitoxin [Nitrosophilus labii]|uniref:type II toxin-antitoxin system Phd/YefM family antitoxin n=1 Tax=Nitrosophilus labii TaxID=2706014 RepID=UPI0016569136|nr:type II toxin-antitoxin system prevent-host-death family antitoxin [Nitrosophilus labii]